MVEGKIKRLIIEMPPRHGKSELVSRRFPAYFLGCHPDAKIIHCAYTAKLAGRENRRVQRIMLGKEYRGLFPAVRIPGTDSGGQDRDNRYQRNNQAFDIIGTDGQYICAGVGGPITGEGMTLGILDDPIKNAEEADSETVRDNLGDWLDSTFRTREEGDDCAIVMTATRWHEDDPIGRTLAQAKEMGEEWTVLRFEALREDMTDKGDPRKEGESLWPAKFSRKKMQDTKKRLLAGRGLRWWNAMFQQKPSSLEGNILKREDFEEYDETGLEVPLPRYIGTVQSLDTAHDTASTNDWSVDGTFKIWTDKNGEAVADLADLWRDRVEFPALKRQAKDLANRDLVMWLLIERKASGISLIQELRKGTRLPIWGPPPDKPGGKPKPLGVIPDKDKVARANAAAGTIQAGRIRIPRNARWKADFLAECANFPNGTFDDQVDMLTQFVNWFRIYWVVPRQKLITNPARGRIRGM